MALTVTLRGQDLTNEQLAVITPVLSDRRGRRISKSKLEQACVDLLAEAGCPIAGDPEAAAPQPK